MTITNERAAQTDSQSVNDPPPVNVGIPYPEMRVACMTFLDATAQLLLADDTVMSTRQGVGAQLAGPWPEPRDRAKAFEKELFAPWVNEHQAEILAAANSRLNPLEGDWEFVATEFTPVFAERSPVDVWVVMLATNGRTGATVTVRQMVNVKYTSGGTYDNTGGAKMANWVFAGKDSGSINGVGAADALTGGGTLPVTDYFFLSFNHSIATEDRVAHSATIVSLLAVDPDSAFRLNDSQSWPGLQLHARNARMDPLTSVEDARWRLLGWVQAREKAKLLQRLHDNEKVEAAMNLRNAQVDAPR